MTFTAAVAHPFTGHVVHPKWIPQAQDRSAHFWRAHFLPSLMLELDTDLTPRFLLENLNRRVLHPLLRGGWCTFFRLSLSSFSLLDGDQETRHQLNESQIVGIPGICC